MLRVVLAAPRRVALARRRLMQRAPRWVVMARRRQMQRAGRAARRTCRSTEARATSCWATWARTMLQVQGRHRPKETQRLVALLYHIFSFAPRLAPLAVGALVAPLAPLA